MIDINELGPRIIFSFGDGSFYITESTIYGVIIAAIILFFAMMERPGLEMWYNFILLYPLAKNISSMAKFFLAVPTP